MIDIAFINPEYIGAELSSAFKSTDYVLLEHSNFSKEAKCEKDFINYWCGTHWLIEKYHS